MKILEYMSFNVAWFTTLPGMLITAGVVVLLIALIVLLSSGGNKKENEVGEIAESSVAAPEMPIQENVPDTSSTVGVPSEPQTINLDVPSETNIPASVPETPVEAPSVPEEKKPGVINFDVPVVPTPAVEEAVSAPEPAVQQPVPETPAEVASPAKPEVTEQPTVSIYGGASPTVNLYSPVEEKNDEKPVIYGGADPLENTAPLPKVDVKDLEPVVAPTEPTVQPTVEIPKQPESVPNVEIPEAPVVQPAVESVETVAPAAPEAPVVPESPVVPEAPAAQETVETLDF